MYPDTEATPDGAVAVLPDADMLRLLIVTDAWAPQVNGVVRTLATLAHDCRRTELFQRELMAALQIVQRQDLPLKDMLGAYAGEIGQTQFLPSSYIKYGVDFDGNGHVDLRHSIPDVLASTANLLRTAGFRGGADYHEGSANFEAMREWNRATIYRKTIAYFADRLAGR